MKLGMVQARVLSEVGVEPVSYLTVMRDPVSHDLHDALAKINAPDGAH